MTRIGKVVGIVSNTLDRYDKVTGIDHRSGRHTRRSDKEDLDLVRKVCKYSKGRQHSKFPLLRCNLFNSINRAKFDSWINH